MTPTTLDRDVEEAVSYDAARQRLRDVVMQALTGGADRAEVLAILDRARLRFRDEGREREEDLVCDVMDLFDGWAHSSLQV